MMRAILVALMVFLLPVAGHAVGTPLPAAGTVVTETEVRRVIGEYLLQKAAPLHAEVSIKKIGYGGELRLPAGRVSFEMAGLDRWEGYGNTSLALIVRVDDVVKRNLNVIVEVEALAETVVATRTLERGEVLTASDLVLARRDLAHLQGGPLLRGVDEAVGLRVKSVIKANSAVRRDYLERVPVIKNGQIVTILLENEVMKITASGRAKGSGAVGDMISVQNLSSQKEIAARIVDASTVRVDF